MAQTLLSDAGAFTKRSLDAINRNFTSLFGGLAQVGTLYYVDPVHGSDTLGTGLTASAAYQTLATAYNACADGHNDIVVLIGNGATTGTARVDSAFTWSKSATHLVGVCSPTHFSQRARIAPTSTTTAFANFFTISGSGCLFQNIQWFQGFATGTTSAIAVTVSGQRNVFDHCHIAGLGDAVSADSNGSRSLKISGAGENVFEDCVIGIDTVTRTTANASLEFSGGTARNLFQHCQFPFQTDTSGVLGVVGTGASCMDRYQTFDNCLFVNNIKSTSTTMTVLGSLTNAAPGGLLLYKQCILVGIGEYGDTIALANSYIDGFTGAAATSGIAVNPS